MKTISKFVIITMVMFALSGYYTKYGRDQYEQNGLRYFD